MKTITQTDAARLKRCSQSAISLAVKRNCFTTISEGRFKRIVIDQVFSAWQPRAAPPPKGAISQAEAARLKGCTNANVCHALDMNFINKVTVGDKNYVKKDATFRLWLKRKSRERVLRMPDGVLLQSEAARIKKCKPVSIFNALKAGRLNSVKVNGINRVKNDAVFKAWQPVTVTGRKRNKSGQYVKTARAKKSNTAKAKK